MKMTGEMVYLLLFLFIAFLILSIYPKRNVSGIILKLLKLAKMQIWLTVSKQYVIDSKI